MTVRRNPLTRLRVAAVALGMLIPMIVLGGQQAQASTLPPNFRDTVVLSGLTNPTTVQFSPDGRVFVGQKNGQIKVFDSLSDTTPDLFADLRPQVNDYWDRGLLGMALDPGFPVVPHVYVLYAFEAPIGGTAPTWNDSCPTPPGPTTDGCLVSGRLSRLTASGNAMSGSEQVLINDWCQQFPSHSVGTLAFGRDGKLYVSGGDGASFNTVDYGQLGASYSGDKANPCGDPPAPTGTALSPPDAQGGALRSQSIRRPSGQPVSLDGAILRIDPATGQGVEGNPFFASTDANARRIVAYGLRNPFRFTQRPGTDEIWVGDVGWGTWEEINRIVSPNATDGRNFGWPCYEGAARQGGYDGANLTSCESLYTGGGHATPHYAYHHGSCVVSYPGCRTGSSSITGIAFYDGASYPAAYHGALFFADHSRNEIWAMQATNGVPDPAKLQCFVCVDFAGLGAGNPVELKTGPNGDLFYVNMEGGSIHRITYTAANQAPTARPTAKPTAGTPPLTVNFDGTGSTDPEGGPLTYSWDFDGDGTFSDATTAVASHTYLESGVYQAALRVTDTQGATGAATVTITVGNTAPTAVIDSPLASLTWQVGDTVSFSGHATDAQDGSLPASALTWTLVVHHCSATNCHEHVQETFPGTAAGTFSAPDHQYPSSLELRLTARDSGGLTSTSSVRLEPRTVALTFKTNPGRLRLSGLTVNESEQATPFTATVIVGSANSISAPSPQTAGRTTYHFVSWSDGGPQSHTIIAPATNTTYTAYYKK